MPEYAATRVDIEGVLTDTLRSVALVVPKLIAFVLILGIGWLLARVLRSAVAAGLRRAGAERMVERAGLSDALQRNDLTASGLGARLVFYAALLVILQVAFSVWGPNPVSALIASVIAWLPRAAVAIVIMVVATAVARGVRSIVGTALGGLSYGRLLSRLTGYSIIGLGAIAALNQVGIATTVTTPVLVTVLATAGGICVVGLGGGLIRPMQARWERWLSRAEHESHAIGQHARAYSAGQSDTRAATTTPAPLYAGASAAVGLTPPPVPAAERKPATTPISTGVPLTPSR